MSLESQAALVLLALGIIVAAVKVADANTRFLCRRFGHDFSGHERLRVVACQRCGRELLDVLREGARP